MFDGGVCGRREDQAPEVAGLVGATGSAGGDQRGIWDQDFLAGQFGRGGELLEHVTQVAGGSPLNAHGALVEIGLRAVAGLPFQGNEQCAGCRQDIPVAEDRPAGGEGAQEQDRAFDGDSLLRNIIYQHRAPVLGRGGGAAARGKALTIRHGPAGGFVALGDHLPGEAAEGDGRRWVGLEDPGVVEAALKVGARRFVAALGELNQAHDVFDADGHGSMLRLWCLVVKGVANYEF